MESHNPESRSSVAPALAGRFGCHARNPGALIPFNHYGFNPMVARPKPGGTPDLKGGTPVPAF